MVFTRVLALAALFAANGAARVNRARRSTGNRGTGLSPGAWKVDGGLKYLGVTLTDASIDIDIVSIDDNTLVFNVLDSTIVNGSNAIPGGYQGITATFKRHNFGLFDNRNGYYVAQNICLVNGQCLTEAFFQENQNKLMVYARSPSLGLTVWLVSGGGAAPRAAALVESTGNRGTGLSPGAWKVDGGLKYLGVTLTDASIDIDIVSIDDNTLVFNVLDSTIVNGSNAIPGGYQGITATFKRHNFGLFDNRNGYYVAQNICLVNGQCLTEAFFQENQNKLMVYARSPSLGLTVWLVSGGGAAPRAAALVETASVAVSVADCGGANHLARLGDYNPKSVNTGATTDIIASGTLAGTVAGGSLNMKIEMSGFPWLTLGQVNNGDFCGPVSMELRGLGIYAGRLDWAGISCPIAAGETTIGLRLTLAGGLPANLIGTRGQLTATTTDGQPLLCATTTTR